MNDIKKHNNSLRVSIFIIEKNSIENKIQTNCLRLEE